MIQEKDAGILGMLQRWHGGYDGHVHTIRSDGEEYPDAVCKRALQQGLCHITITDHDVLMSEQEAKALSLAHGIDVINGIELNVTHYLKGKKVIGHLGLQWVPDGAIDEILAHNRTQLREIYCRHMLEKLYRQGIDPSGRGVDASWQMLLADNPDSQYLGKRAVGKLLVKAGIAADQKEARERYVGRSGIAYVDQTELFDYADMEWVLKTVNDYNASHQEHIVVTLNHIYYYRLEEMLEDLFVQDFADMGGHALEVIYPQHTPQRERRLRGLCDRTGLLVNGGSDTHGSDKTFLDAGAENFRRLRAFHLREEE